MMKLILRAVSLGASVGMVVLLTMNSIKESEALILLGLGVCCLSISVLPDKKKED